MSSVRKRKNGTTPPKGKGVFHTKGDYGSQTDDVAGADCEQVYPGWMGWASLVAGVAVMLYCGYTHSWFMYTLNENNLWFSNIKEVEREISFRTESGLYYSYYKQVVAAPSLSQGVHDLMHDRLTEYPATINILERMNVYQELILATIYRILPEKLQKGGIFFYVDAVFALHGLLVAALFLMTWLLSHSWLAGFLTAVFYTLNRIDTTRVAYTMPLRESFALPFIWVQAAAMTYYFRPSAHGWRKHASVAVMGVATFLFCLFWQFNQFVMLLQAFALFGLWVLDILPAGKVQTVFTVQAASLLAVCALQFMNKMILGSLVLSFIPASFIVMHFRGSRRTSAHWAVHVGKVGVYSIGTLFLMGLINAALKLLLQVEADEHIFKFLQNKFTGEEVRDFDSLLYLCLSIFGFLTLDVYQRLTKGFVLPFYIAAHLGLLLITLVDVLKQMKGYGSAEQKEKFETSPKTDEKVAAKRENKTVGLALLKTRPELVFHTVQCVFFGALAMTTLRMKYLWTPYMCVFAAVGLGDRQLWASVLSRTNSKSRAMVDACRHVSVAIVLAAVLITMMPTVYKELQILREFWDPDTVELMGWIQNNTAPLASFSGSMQLMAAIKLCTGRPINNHPHYEDKELRRKTKLLYQVYGRRSPEDLHTILTDLKSQYVILEDSICLASSTNNCRTPQIVDLDNGVVPDGGEMKPGLSHSTVPRFCYEVRHQKPQYAKLFKVVFLNKTFRILKVM